MNEITDVEGPSEGFWTLACEEMSHRMDPDESSRRRKALEEKGEHGYITALLFAYCAMGDREKAKRYFAEAVKERLKERGERQ